MKKLTPPYHLFILGALAIVAIVAATTIEVPLAINHVYLRRLPGNFEFYYVGRLPSTGRLVAMPESEIGRFLQLAEENGFNSPELHTLLPKSQALKQVAKATIVIEETDIIQFYRSSEGIWIKWNEEAPPVITVDGAEVTTFGWTEIPLSPSGTTTAQK